jgi:Peptidase family M48/Tetratricopeptide repeat
MRLRIALLLTLAALAAGLVVAERRRAQAPVSAQSLLYLVADSERDLTRLPSHFTRLSDKEEIAAGNALAKEYLAERKLSADGEQIEAMLDRLRARIAPHAHRRLPYRFHFIPGRAFINAFALPGGHVFVGAGLLERMTTEDELASVLAHEVEHVDHYHCAERLQVEAALRKVPLGAVLSIPIAVFQAGYSKDQELEADREGVLLAARSGYSAAGALRAFQMLDRLAAEVRTASRTPQGEAARVALDIVLGYFRTHPPTPERIAQVRTMIARQPQLAAAPERPLAVEYIVLAWKALDAVSEEKFAQASALASRALQQHPGHVPAMQALCEADYGLGEHAAAVTLYRKLLESDTAAADAVEKWGEERAEKLPHDRAIALIESLLTVQPSQPRLLRLAAWAYAMKGDTAAANEKAATIRRLYADTAPQLAGDAEVAAAKALTANEFAAAAAMARVALTLDPTLRAAQQTLGDAELAQAHFAAAAEAYKAMFDANNIDAAWLQSFADALGAAHPTTASADLQALVPTAQVEIAGLALLVGNDAKARDVVQAVEKGTIAPELLARLGWWYLRAHRAADAEAVLVKARSLRPGDADIQSALAWTTLERGQTPTAAPADDARDALAAWQLGRKADALQHWSQTKPQWRNAAWRAALYPPRVDALAQQVETERVRIAEANAVRFKRR